MLSSEKELLSFEEFQEQVLEAFNCTKEECDFWSSSYYFSALINYINCQWLFFTVKYSIDPDSCNYGRWIVVKEYDKACKDISDSLIQGIKVVARKTEQSIKEEIAIFEKINTQQLFIEDLGNGITLEMVAIPGGAFLMGTEDEKDSFGDERPQHEVNVPPFFIGKYPITQAQWQAIAVTAKIDIDLETNPSNFKGDELPVERVNWYQATEFCKRLSRETKREYRLPSEAEWEYACRAGTTTPFYFGETITADLANYRGTKTYADEPTGEYRQQTTPVGQFPPNAFGLYDMHGNVWEWCADTWHHNYKGAPTDGRVWVENGDDNYSPLRGGCWGDDPDCCRSAYRSLSARRGYSFNGFRVVCD